EVRPGGEDALAEGVGPLIDLAVDDLEAQVGHADLVGVGEREGDLHLGVVLADGIDFSADVLARALYVEEMTLQLRPNGGHGCRSTEPTIAEPAGLGKVPAAAAGLLTTKAQRTQSRAPIPALRIPPLRLCGSEKRGLVQG